MILTSNFEHMLVMSTDICWRKHYSWWRHKFITARQKRKNDFCHFWRVIIGSTFRAMKKPKLNKDNLLTFQNIKTELKNLFWIKSYSYLKICRKLPFLSQNRWRQHNNVGYPKNILRIIEKSQVGTICPPQRVLIHLAIISSSCVEKSIWLWETKICLEAEKCTCFFYKKLSFWVSSQFLTDLP